MKAYRGEGALICNVRRDGLRLVCRGGGGRGREMEMETETGRESYRMRESGVGQARSRSAGRASSIVYCSGG